MNPAAPSGPEDGLDVRQMLRQSLDAVLARHYSFEQRRDAYRSPAGHSVEAWSAYRELGLLALALPEEYGGFPGTLGDLAMVAESMGGALTLEPYRAAMVAARLLAAAGTPAQQARWLPALIEGRCIAVLAHPGLGEPIQAHAIGADAAGWRITGGVAVVPGGDMAELFIVPARAEGGIELFLVEAASVERRARRCFDWTGMAALAFRDVPVPADARLADGEAALARALDEAATLACADAVGTMRAANGLTRDYALTRRQFGAPVASFQVIQHRLVDMAIAEEMARAILTSAVAACEGSDPAQRARAVSAAKVTAGDAARQVAQQCVQIHGGMGLAEEYPAAHHFARLGLFERLFGDRDAHLRRIVAPDGNGGLHRN